MSVWFTSNIKMPLRNIRIKGTTNTIHILVLDLRLPYDCEMCVILKWKWTYFCLYEAMKAIILTDNRGLDDVTRPGYELFYLINFFIFLFSLM